jgi:hypothetical protein
MATKIGICQQALSAIRANAITSLDEGSPESLACLTHYDAQLEATLRDHPWNFATDYVALAQSTNAPPPNWAYAFARPSDCVLARLVLPAVKGGTPPPFERAGNLILTDQGASWLCYTKLVSDPTLFDPMFSTAFAMRLAVAIAPALTADRGWVQAVFTQYENAIRAARAVDSSEGAPETARDPSWVSATGIDTQYAV